MIQNTALKGFYLGLVAVILMAATTQNGCKSGQPAQLSPAKPATEARSTDFLLKKIKAREANAAKIQDMTARLKIAVQQPAGNLTVSGNMVWLRDSALCVAIKKFGYEAVRGLVTKDSVFVLYRLEKEYTAASIESLQRQFNLPAKVTPELLAQVLLGQMLVPDQTPLKSSIEDGKHQLRAMNNTGIATYLIEEGSFSLVEQSFIRVSDQNSVQIQTEQFTKIDPSGYFMPYLRRITSTERGRAQGTVVIEFDDVVVNTTPTYKFEIPAHYTKRAE
jgi:hypothetical protein